MIGIYKITCIENNRVYVGSSTNLNIRKRTHFSDLEKNQHYNERMQNTWNKYGADSFIFEILEELPEDISRKEMFIREQYFIDLFKCYTHGLNMSKNAEVPIKEWTGEDRLEASIRNTGSGNPFFGKKHSKETINKIINNRPRIQGENNPFFGKKHSQETKDKIAATKLATKLSGNYKHPTEGTKLSEERIETIKNNMSTSVRCIINGIEYRSQSDASKILSIPISTISKRINNDKFSNYIKKCND